MVRPAESSGSGLGGLSRQISKNKSTSHLFQITFVAYDGTVSGWRRSALGKLDHHRTQALLGVGHSPIEARARLDRALVGGRTFKSSEEILLEIYKQKE